jgi:uncharacterized protein YbjQ (UPF0145 family)
MSGLRQRQGITVDRDSRTRHRPRTARQAGLSGLTLPASGELAVALIATDRGSYLKGAELRGACRGRRRGLATTGGASLWFYAMTESAPGKFPVTTGFELPGMVVDTDLGLAFGLVVRSMGIAKSFGASFTALRQGEVSQYTQLLEDSRRHAIDRMVENAKLLGGNAVIAMRFDSSEIGQQLTEIVAYGTAVVVRPSGT